MTSPGGRRSALSVSVSDIIAFFAGGAITWFSNTSIFWTIEPIYADVGTVVKRQALLTETTPILALISALSAVFFVRAIRHDVRGFTRLENLAIAWPGLVYVPFAIVMGMFMPFVFPTGFGLLLAVALRLPGRSDRLGLLLAILSHVAAIAYTMRYAEQMWLLFGD
ncbi:MAG: hypothetical protein ABIQ99_12130 [Thermoflexales bacterium]